MKHTVVLGMAQPYPGYGCEQVTIVASRIPDTIVAPLVKHVTTCYYAPRKLFYFSLQCNSQCSLPTQNSFLCGHMNIRASTVTKFRKHVQSDVILHWRVVLRPVALVRTDASEELCASFIRVTRIDELRTTLAVTSNRRTQRASVASYSYRS
jgi:hypothetical protein